MVEWQMRGNVHVMVFTVMFGIGKQESVVCFSGDVRAQAREICRNLG